MIIGISRRNRLIIWLFLVIMAASVILGFEGERVSAQRKTLYWGSRGSDVVTLQSKLRAWGYYKGPVDGVFGARTASAVRTFQRRNGLRADGVVGGSTWQALGLSGGGGSVAYAATRGVSRGDSEHLLARLVTAEAGAEPYTGKVAVAAVVLNRTKHPSFPNSVSGVIYQPMAFESVSNGWINKPPNRDSVRAARQALNGWDPTYGATFFWNPSKPVNRWIWSRSIVTRIGKHVFAR